MEGKALADTGNTVRSRGGGAVQGCLRNGRDQVSSWGSSSPGGAPVYILGGEMARGRSRTEDFATENGRQRAELMSGGWEKGTQVDPTRDLGPGSPRGGDVRSCGTLACSAESHGLS